MSECGNERLVESEVLVVGMLLDEYESVSAVCWKVSTLACTGVAIRTASAVLASLKISEKRCSLSASVSVSRYELYAECTFAVPFASSGAIDQQTLAVVRSVWFHDIPL